MTTAKREEADDFEAWKARIQKTISDVEYETNPATQSLRQMEKENRERIAKESKAAQREAWHQVIYFIIVVALIPVLIWLWNIHPVLGLLGIVAFVWLVRNKIKTGYYFGY